mgnify:CR=1 FL=1
MRRAQAVLLWGAAAVLFVLAFAAVFPGVLATHDPLPVSYTHLTLPTNREV